MKKITDIQEGPLQYILGKLTALKTLEKKISPYLPAEIRPFCRLSNIENGVLKLAVPNSVWGTRLRYSLPDLLENLRHKAGLSHIRAINYYIEPDFDKIFKVF